MITLHPITAGSGIDYLLATVASEDVELGAFEVDDQWNLPSDTPGEWVGRASRWLGLHGAVTRQQADALFKRGEHPETGDLLGARWPAHRTVDERYAALLAREPNASPHRREQLLARAQSEGERVARAGWELVFTPVKSFEVLWGLADDAARRTLARIENQAFRKVLERIENEAIWVRHGRGSVIQEQGDGMVAAVFLHRSSRAGDPGLHRHLAISAKVPFGGRWLALDARPLHRLAVVYSELYTAEIERGMADQFGITARPLPGNLADRRPVREFHGLSPSVLSAFSARRRQTEKALAILLGEFRLREGREPTRAEQYRIAQVAALKNRPAKRARTAEQERSAWRAQARALGLAHPERLLETALTESERARAGEPARPPLHAIPGLVIHELEQHRGIWTRPNVEAEVIRQLTATGWHIALGERFDSRIDVLTDAVIGPAWCERLDAPELVAPPPAYLRPDGTAKFRQVASTRYTSHRTIAAEQLVLAAASRPAPLAPLDADAVDAALAADEHARGFAATDEQRGLLRALFASDRRVQAVIGRAGTGKTTLMGMAKQVADAHAIPVLGLTRSQVQAGQLAKATGMRAENIAKWRHHSEHVAPGDPRWSIPTGAIVILDEAAQAATPDIAAILRQVADADGRLILVGDPLQLGAVGAGGLLAHLETDGHALYLTENRRFRDAGGRERTWETEAAHALARGDAELSFAAYDRRGRIRAGGHDAMLEDITAAYLRDLDDGLASILIGADNATTAVLSERVRAARIAAGRVRTGGRTAPLGDGNHAAVGDIVETRKNDSRIRSRTGRGYVLNGDLWTVLAVGRDGSLTVKHQISGARARLHGSYVHAHVALGYAITKDRAQGVTADTAHALVNATMTRAALYPAITRGRRANHVYLDIGVHIDPDTGEPRRELTARQLWSQVLARPGHQPTALIAQREAWNEIGTLQTLYQRLRYTLEDLRAASGEHLQLAGADLGPILAAWPAWPALRDALVALERAGLDPVAVLDHVIRERDLTDADDLAAVLHYRINAHADYARILAAPRPSSPPTPAADGLEGSYDPRDEDPAPGAAGRLLLDDLGLTLPDAADTGDKAIYARRLAAAMDRRARELADLALAAASGEGWTRAYGPPPADEREARAWTRRLTSAALYRDLVGHTGEHDPVGPTPDLRNAALRRLWRAALPAADPAAAAAEAFAAAATGAPWLAAVGPAPATHDPLHALWLSALRAVLDYRTYWSYEHEDAAIGPRPREPVQGADWETARRALASLTAARPAAARLAGAATDSELAQHIARGQDAAADASAAEQAREAFHQAVDTALRAHQAAHDAVNRAVAAADDAAAASDPRARHSAEARVAELWTRALAAADDARAADLALEEIKARHRRYVPEELANRALTDLGRASRVEQARRAADPQPAAHGHWRRRPFGHMTDQQLAAAHADALDAASAADAAARDRSGTPTDAVVEQAARALHPDLAARLRTDPLGSAAPWKAALAQLRLALDADATDVDTEMTAAAADARERATAIRAELRVRALMRPSQRERESRERSDRAGQPAENSQLTEPTSSIASAQSAATRDDLNAQATADRSPRI